MSAVRRHAFVLVAAGLLLTGTVRGQQRTGQGGQWTPLDPVRFGPHLGYNFDAQALALGAQETLPITQHIEVYPSFDYYFIDPGSLWALNADVKFRPPTRLGVLYVGGGLNYLHQSVGPLSSGDVNLNLLGGLEFRRRPFVPFVEGRLILGNGSAFQVVGGVNFQLR